MEGSYRLYQISIQTIKHQNGTTISNEEERLDRWAEHFEQQMSWPPAGTHLQPTGEVEPWTVNVEPPTASEVYDCICSLKRHRAPGWGPCDPHCAWLETLQDMAANQSQWRSCCQFLSRLPEPSNQSWLYGSEASVLDTDVKLSMMRMMMRLA
ncbi:hypothetical protein T265_05856 [Opisthorchis viverrini]|uniref:Uncharacterized protein n=1 Tax=Opisthorchis viverrini TaxID=6198 RepID=A0A074ZUG1_OPIVI|nr:hypothetical protein T265_05856 [Opisthorchis viverrini]KER27025.1 hypothetical protein T265_05856 [Opisthorchis viverrini]